jgi:hypothetical protein
MLPHQTTRCAEAELRALSISRRVWMLLQGGMFRARVLAVFERACDLLTADGHLLALVLPHIGDGPLSIVVEGAPGDFALVEPGTRASLARDCLQVGCLSISLTDTSLWEPRPGWRSLRARHETVKQQLPHLRTTALRHAPEGSLLALLPSLPLSAPAGPRPGSRNWESRLSTAFLASAQTGAEAVRRGWNGSAAGLQSGAAQLAGLGGGLTPAGDDFLTGLMLWAWLAHPTPQRLCYVLAEAAIPRTTVLSAALLKAATAGECNTAWHRLLRALASGDRAQIPAAVENILSHGHTSGADALAGFLWLPSVSPLRTIPAPVKVMAEQARRPTC